MNDLKFRYSATLKKAGNLKNGKIPITIIPNYPTTDRVNDTIISDAFLEAREEFLKDGIIDYDHISVLGKSDFERAQAIIGEPEELTVKNGIPFCDAYLFEKNPYVRDAILPALETNSTVWAASVGGRTLKSEPNGGRFSKKKGQKITKILLKHIAITPAQKAIHPMTLVSLRKSMNNENELFFDDFTELIKSFSDSEYLQKALIAGTETDIAEMEGGQALQKQSIEKTPIRKNIVMDALNDLIIEIISNKIHGSDQYLQFLGQYNLSNQEIQMIIAVLKNRIPKIIEIKKSFI